jgi:hypothetical protein
MTKQLRGGIHKQSYMLQPKKILAVPTSGVLHVHTHMPTVLYVTLKGGCLKPQFICFSPADPGLLYVCVCSV